MIFTIERLQAVKRAKVLASDSGIKEKEEQFVKSETLKETRYAASKPSSEKEHKSLTDSFLSTSDKSSDQLASTTTPHFTGFNVAEILKMDSPPQHGGNVEEPGEEVDLRDTEGSSGRSSGCGGGSGSVGKETQADVKSDGSHLKDLSSSDDSDAYTEALETLDSSDED